MRPIRPLAELKPPRYVQDYNYWQPHMIQRYGPYCAYCECRFMPYGAVDHRISKSLAPELTDEKTNFLLACTACNSAKSDKVSYDNVNNYIWPDRSDTSRVFTYNPDGTVDAIDSDGLESDLGDRFPDWKRADWLRLEQRAVNTIELVGLQTGNRGVFGGVDPRHAYRRGIHELARELLSQKASSDLVLKVALRTGCWSVWVSVFSGSPTTVRRLWDEFPGTQTKFCPIPASSPHRNTPADDVVMAEPDDEGEGGRTRSAAKRRREPPATAVTPGRQTVTVHDDEIAGSSATSQSAAVATPTKKRKGLWR